MKIIIKLSQVKLNLISNIVFLVCSVLVGMYYTPYLVNTLGIVAYGIIPLTLIINQYISVITGALTSSLSRFLSISIQRKNFNEASKYISSAIAVVFFIILILLPLLWMFIANLNNVFTIPIKLLSTARYLFSFTILSFFTSLISSVFNISQYANNRLDLLNILKCLRVVLKFIGIIIIFELVHIDLVYVGLVNLLTEILVLVVSIAFFIKQTKGEIKISPFLFNKNALFLMLGMTSWTVIHQLGDTTLYQMDVFFINRFFDTSYSGVIGAFITFGSYIIVIISVISNLFGPLILKSYSENKHEYLVKMTLNTSYLMGALSAILVGVLLGFSKQFIFCWLGNDFVEFNSWLIIKLCWLPFYASAGIYAYVNRAHNKVRIPALITLIFGFINILGLFLLYKFNPFGDKIIVIGLIYSGVLAVLQSYGLNGWAFNKIYKGSTKRLFTNLLIILSVLIISYLSSYIINCYIKPNNLIELLFILALISLVLLINFFCFVLTNNQKRLLLSIFNF